jgi:hypothetical protein
MTRDDPGQLKYYGACVAVSYHGADGVTLAADQDSHILQGRYQYIQPFTKPLWKRGSQSIEMGVFRARLLDCHHYSVLHKEESNSVYLNQ